MNWPLTRGAEPLPHVGWWVVLGIALALHLSMPLGWAVGLGLLLLVVAQRFKPLDFITSYLLVVVGASLINYSRGALTFELSVLTAGILFSMFCYAIEQRRHGIVVTHTFVTLPLILFVALSVLNFGRGLVIGNSARYAGLELIAALGMGSALLVAARPVDRALVRTLVIWLWIMCLVHGVLGVYAYATIRVRVSAIYFTPVPGVVFALLFNFAIRARSMGRSMLGLLLLTPLLVHQFLSFTRGYWFALIGSTVFSVLMYMGRGPGSGARLKRATLGLLFLTGVGAVGAGVVSATLGLGDIMGSAGSRFASSAGTEMSWETASNVVRLAEYFHVIDLVIERPWFGYGLGYSYTIRELIGWRLMHKWFVHHNYLLVMFKQGVIGLILFVWLLVAALRTGLKGRSLPEGWQRAWCMGAAASTVWLLIYCNVHFPLAEVNTVFTAALIWGVAMAMTSKGRTVLRWRVPGGRTSGPEPTRSTGADPEP